MRTNLKYLPSFFSLILACSNSSTTTIPPSEMNTSAARLHNHMEKNQVPKCAPFCGTEHDWLKDEAHVVVDEVTLISRRPSTCFGVKIRALKQEDSAISKMGIQCTISDRQVSALSSNERGSVVEYTHGQDQLDRKVLLHGVSDLEFGVHIPVSPRFDLTSIQNAWNCDGQQHRPRRPHALRPSLTAGPRHPNLGYEVSNS